MKYMKNWWSADRNRVVSLDIRWSLEHFGLGFEFTRFELPRGDIFTLYIVVLAFTASVSLTRNIEWAQYGTAS